MDVPKIFREENDTLFYNVDNKTLILYVPEEYFSNTKTSIAQISGQYVSLIGICNWDEVSDNGTHSKLRTFNLPTMFLCKPSSIESVKRFKLADLPEANYRLLKFRKGDEVISQLRVPQLIDNAEIFFKMAVMTAKLPQTIPCDKLWELFLENAKLNGFKYNLNLQLFWILISVLCRDPEDITIPFRLGKMSSMLDYKLVGIEYAPKFISPYSSLISKGFDEDIKSAILMKDTPEEELPYSPLEKIIMM